MSDRSVLDDARRLSELYGEHSIAEIGDLIGVSRTTVLRAMVRLGIERRGRGDAARARISNPRLADRVWLADRYAVSTIRQIAREVGADTATVRRALVLHRIEVRRPGTGPRDDRPAVLDDPAWLAARYATALSIREIARELGVNEQMVGAALRRHGIDRRSRSKALKRELADLDRLAGSVEALGTADAAAEFGVSQVGVQRALARAGRPSPRRYDAGRAPVPDEGALRRAWDQEQTIKGVARRFGASPTRASVWLAEIGVFVREEPAIGRSVLVSAIECDWSIAEICQRERVTASTVVVELHRHGLFEAHRRRHLRRVGGER